MRPSSASRSVEGGACQEGGTEGRADIEGDQLPRLGVKQREGANHQENSEQAESRGEMRLWQT